MVTGALKSQVDKIWEAFWSGGIANGLTVIEQLTYLILFQFEAGVRLIDDSVDEAEDDYVKVEMIALFASEYQLSEAASFDEDAMSEFLNHNVRHHVWPYWREYLQSTCTCMGLPVIPVPHQFYPLATEKTA